MKFQTKKTIVVEEEVDVDDRLYKDDTIEWQMVNMILDGRLASISDDLFEEDECVVRDAASKINAAFRKADDCLSLIRSGKFEA